MFKNVSFLQIKKEPRGPGQATRTGVRLLGSHGDDLLEACRLQGRASLRRQLTTRLGEHLGGHPGLLDLEHRGEVLRPHRLGQGDNHLLQADGILGDLLLDLERYGLLEEPLEVRVVGLLGEISILAHLPGKVGHDVRFLPEDLLDLSDDGCKLCVGQSAD